MLGLGKWPYAQGQRERQGEAWGVKAGEQGEGSHVIWMVVNSFRVLVSGIALHWFVLIVNVANCIGCWCARQPRLPGRPVIWLRWLGELPELRMPQPYELPNASMMWRVSAAWANSATVGNGAIRSLRSVEMHGGPRAHTTGTQQGTAPASRGGHFNKIPLLR